MIKQAPIIKRGGYGQAAFTKIVQFLEGQES